MYGSVVMALMKTFICHARFPGYTEAKLGFAQARVGHPVFGFLLCPFEFCINISGYPPPRV